MAQGLELMLVGMGTVFFFLTALVGATSLMSALVMKYAPPELASDDPPDEEIAAIGAAIAQHRARRRGE